MRAKIRNLAAGGMVNDIPKHDLAPNHVTNAVNVEFRDGAVSRAWGFSRDHDITGTPVWWESWFSLGNGRSIVVSEIDSEGSPATLITEIANGVASDITPATPITAGAEWDSTVFGASAVLINDSVVPYSRSILDTGELTQMPNWPETWRAKMIRAYRNFLVALAVTRDAATDDTRIQWSNASANNGLPPDWDELDPASLAGGVSLAGHAGPIQDAAVLGQSLIIYMQNAAYALAFGGQSVMSVRPLFNLGLLNRGCVINFAEFHLCIGNGLIYTHDGSSVSYPAEQIVQERFFSEMVDPGSVHMANDIGRKTVEIFYKDHLDTPIPNKVLRWSYQTNTWSFNDLGDFGAIRAKYAPDSQRLVTWDSLDDDIGSGTVVAWSAFSVTWRSMGAEPGKLSLKLMVDAPGGSAIMRREPVFLRDGTTYESLIEREGIDFDEILEGQDPLSIQSIKHTKRVLPQILGQGTVYFQFGTSPNPNAGTVWGNIIPFDIETDYKVDFRASGRYFAWRMYNDPAVPTTFRLSGFDLNVEVAGER